MNRLLLIILLSGFVALSCTHNPLFDDQLKGGDGATLRGTVTLNDGETPDRIYVWLESANAGSYTDSLGQFELIVPSPEVQPGGGLSGNYNLYYYCGNYRLAFQPVFFVRGVAQYGQAAVDESGHLADVQLSKLLDLSVSLESDSYNIHSAQDFWIFYSLTLPPGAANQNIHVELYHRSGDYNGIANIFFLPLNEPISHAILYRTTDIKSTRWTRGNEIKVFNDTTSHFNFPPGQYKVIPYLHILQDNVPPQLLYSLGADPDTLSYKFLNIPYKRDMPTLTVVE